MFRPPESQAPVSVERFFNDMMGRDFAISGILRHYELLSDPHADPHFDGSQITLKDFTQQTEGLSSDEVVSILVDSTSVQNFAERAARARFDAQSEDEMATWGGWRIPSRLVLNLFDPFKLILLAALILWARLELANAYKAVAANRASKAVVESYRTYGRR